MTQLHLSSVLLGLNDYFEQNALLTKKSTPRILVVEQPLVDSSANGLRGLEPPYPPPCDRVPRPARSRCRGFHKQEHGSHPLQQIASGHLQLLAPAAPGFHFQWQLLWKCQVPWGSHLPSPRSLQGWPGSLTEELLFGDVHSPVHGQWWVFPDLQQHDHLWPGWGSHKETGLLASPAKPTLGPRPEWLPAATRLPGAVGSVETLPPPLLSTLS